MFSNFCNFFDSKRDTFFYTLFSVEFRSYARAFQMLSKLSSTLIIFSDSFCNVPCGGAILLQENIPMSNFTKLGFNHPYVLHSRLYLFFLSIREKCS